MKKVALVFLLAVFVPSLVLAWLAVRSLRDQQLVVERQATLLAEQVADGIVRNLAGKLTEIRGSFTNLTERLLTDSAAPSADGRLDDFADSRSRFDESLRAAWPLATVGFAVSFTGECYSPSMFSSAEARSFRLANEKFLCNRESLEVVWNGPKGRIPLSELDQTALKSSAVFAQNGLNVPPAPAGAGEQSFRDLIGSERDGAVARFVNGQLNLLLWYRPPANPFLVFGAQLNPGALRAKLAEAVHLEPGVVGDFAAVLLDDDRQPAAQTPANFDPTGRRALAAAEVGDVLPHWRVAVFARDPARLTVAATTARLTLGLLVVVLILAIGAGGWLIFADLRRQLALARQKTDFVSNVSHELKTPLTSIRMFAELLAEERVAEPAKRKQFLGIIGTEAARLTRLINNVLDFARLERGEKSWQFAPLDFREVVREAVESCRPQLEAVGIALNCELAPEAVPICGDHDGLAQVVVNLLSNVEKYATAGREATVRLIRDAAGANAILEVLDRGPGVPAGCAERIFEQFFRAHDSLASGIQGSGLGLTLARQIARAHGSDVTYSPREGGGSVFTLQVPLRSAGTDQRRLSTC